MIRLLCGIAAAAIAGLPAAAGAAGRIEEAAPRYLTVEVTGRAAVEPDVVHLMMKMESSAGPAAEAAAQGERRLGEFLEAVDELGIPGLSYKVFNNVYTPQRGELPGLAYVRNIVFTLTGTRRAEWDGIIARIEDLGARYNSHCVTCIGSG